MVLVGRYQHHTKFDICINGVTILWLDDVFGKKNAPNCLNVSYNTYLCLRNNGF